MPRKSTTTKSKTPAQPRLVRAQDIPPTSAADLQRLRAAMKEPVDTREIPEKKGPFQRIHRDAQGRLPQPRPELRDSPVRTAILAELGRRRMTRYALWQDANAQCPSLSQSAVYEFLAGHREIGLKYIEALLGALGLGIAHLTTTAPKPRRR